MMYTLVTNLAIISLRSKLTLPLVTCAIDAIYFWHSLVEHFSISNTDNSTFSVYLFMYVSFGIFLTSTSASFIQLGESVSIGCYM